MLALQFSKKSEYACIAMLELAARHGDGQPVRLKAIADTHGIPQRFLVQILLQLKGSGLVASTRGAAGGYELARAPDTISLADVVGLIDRGDAPAPRNADAASSPFVQAIHGVWKDVQAEQQRILETTTLAVLVARARETDSLVYQI